MALLSEERVKLIDVAKDVADRYIFPLSRDMVMEARRESGQMDGEV